MPDSLYNSTMSRLFQIESGGDFNAQNPTSSARGRGQFIRSTWRGLMGDAPMTPENQQIAERKYYNEIQSTLSNRLGRQPEPWEVYAAWQQGPQGAIDLMNAPSDAPLTNNQKANNPFGATTNGQWLAAWRNRFNGVNQPAYQYGLGNGRSAMIIPEDDRENSLYAEASDLDNRNGNDYNMRTAGIIARALGGGFGGANATGNMFSSAVLGMIDKLFADPATNPDSSENVALNNMTENNRIAAINRKYPSPNSAVMPQGNNTGSGSRQGVRPLDSLVTTDIDTNMEGEGEVG